MASADRSKKKQQIWKKAVVHFLICFVMGFFTGFAPATKSPSYRASPSPQSEIQQNSSSQLSNLNRNLAERPQPATPPPLIIRGEGEEIDTTAKRLVILITPVSDKERLRGVLLGRLANTLKLVAPPLLWIVVETESERSSASEKELLRKTGVMYRHLVLKENISDAGAEKDHQRNLALNHIEHHRLSGIVHFAGLENVYDLSFFDEIRAIEMYGILPVAKLSSRSKQQVIEGPLCYSREEGRSDLMNLDNEISNVGHHISDFAFNSSILWDPERWGRLSSIPDTKQDSLKFVRQAIFEDQSKLKGVSQEGCSKVKLWQLHLSPE